MLEGDILHAIRERRGMAHLYYITFASNGIDQLDILPSYFVREKRIRNTLPLIVGAALGKAEAYDVVARIAEDAYRHTGSCDLQRWLIHNSESEAQA